MVERKYLAHYLDAAFDTTYAATEYARLGKNLEEYSEELNPDVNITKNILGEQSVQHSGYEVQSDVDPYYFHEIPKKRPPMQIIHGPYFFPCYFVHRRNNDSSILFPVHCFRLWFSFWNVIINKLSSFFTRFIVITDRNIIRVYI